jgi:hypothetical protein
MYGYMEYIQRSFNRSTNWNEENSYANVIETAQSKTHESILEWN